MSGNENNNEDVAFKVTDRRKFNPDGSLKDGVTLEPDAPKPEPEAAKPVAENAAAQPEARVSEPEPHEHNDAADDETEIPGADDPASFINFLSTIATNAAAALGAVPHPATGQRSVDLDTGKYWLDVLSMLKERTDGNLHPQEARLFDGLLADMRMQYVTMVRATEEKLKERAAQKFSGSDILGKK